jgi:hypothetical protein
MFAPLAARAVFVNWFSLFFLKNNNLEIIFTTGQIKSSNFYTYLVLHLTKKCFLGCHSCFYIFPKIRHYTEAHYPQDQLRAQYLKIQTFFYFTYFGWLEIEMFKILHWLSQILWKYQIWSKISICLKFWNFVLVSCRP